ncbi:MULTISPECIES: hypothetical protein [Pseudomonas]|uniref:Uncharacterized protein n=1 Tax=Pseudomonas quercus TaxID=2722792 RepID=A0ABX0YDD0_9PSED|nr:MULTISPECIES: hypothetical protein [Pseudomonas]MBF7144988.1 hypothetical protein [Pseudomonas sp. LY10J]NJP01287.1 hypothetical protein [Pseudomonas quercus]
MPQGQYTDWDRDNFKFLARELFLYLTAAFIKQDRFDELGSFLSQDYYIHSNINFRQNCLSDHSIFSWHLASLEFRNRIKGFSKTSLPATLLKERSGIAGTVFSDIMQADFLLYLRSHINIINGLDSPSGTWWPDTMVYVGHYAEPFEIFLKSSSASYYERIRPLLSDLTRKQFIEIVENLVSENQLPKFGWDRLRVNELIGVNSIGKRP